MKKWSYLVIGFVLLALLMGMIGGAGEQPQRKIVVFQPWVENEKAQDELIERTGAVKIKSLPLVNAVVVLAGKASDKVLREHPLILRVEDDGLVSIVKKPTPPPQPPQTWPWGVNRIDADLVWATNTGAGIRVAVLDTGIQLDHPDLKVYGGINTINPKKTANDDNGHGTHVAGIIAALNNTIGVVGVAPGAHLYAVKVLNRQGFGWWSDVIEGIEWSINNGMQVINMSFGSSSAPQSVHTAIISAYQAGIVLVAAAGNSGPDENTVIFPAKYPEVIAVGATDSTDTAPSWSSRGSEVELAAPGVNIYSTYIGSTYKTLSGTSMASPHVAGTAALVIASGVATTPDAIRTLLQQTADDLGATGRDTTYGFGLVDAQQAATGVEDLP